MSRWHTDDGQPPVLAVRTAPWLGRRHRFQTDRMVGPELTKHPPGTHETVSNPGGISFVLANISGGDAMSTAKTNLGMPGRPEPDIGTGVFYTCPDTAPSPSGDDCVSDASAFAETLICPLEK